ncbi:MAG TPA: glycosyltransferase family 4 protein [Kouleothrix sp.]|uniref:glycosyltransferase family 4 protein n=1 Tax=Kouleothrix sp. TaxID=2779161 RepID=UPI002C6CBE77|nr:glycosyltransferase family 4 protein [Kouleothrix sp.]HRC77226.1 glycosyltransferase family 4 protein [Kouleothrix sp.]
MRVLTLSWEYPPHVVGGMGKHIMDLAPALAQQGIEMHIVTPLMRGGAKRETTADGIHIYRVEPPHMDAYGFVSYVQHTNGLMEYAARSLREEIGPFDLIHSHDWLAAHSGVSLKHAWRRPLVATIHATERGRQGGYIGSGHAEQVNHIEWWLTYEAWRAIACSHFMARQVNSYFGTPYDKIDVVANGVYVHPNPFASAEERLAFRRRYAQDDEPLVFYVGRLVYEKGLHVLLDSWPRVRESFPRARLVIAGTGAYLDTLKHRAWALGIVSSVNFAGFISDDERDKLYHCADVAAFPSLYEPFGIVALEAMAACCPVVVAETGGLAEVVKLHETGLTVHPNDPASLAWGILHTLRHPEWSRTRVANALAVARDMFNWRQIALETAAVYQRTYGDWLRDSWGK